MVPLQWFIENPFENWTRTSSQILGTVILHLDFATPVEPLRADWANAQAAATADRDRSTRAVGNGFTGAPSVSSAVRE